MQYWIAKESTRERNRVQEGARELKRVQESIIEHKKSYKNTRDLTPSSVILCPLTDLDLWDDVS